MIDQAQEFFTLCLETGIITLAFLVVVGAILYLEIKYSEK